MGMPDRISRYFQYSMIPQMASRAAREGRQACPNLGWLVSQAGIRERAPGRETSQHHEGKGVAGHWQAARELLRPRV